MRRMVFFFVIVVSVLLSCRVIIVAFFSFSHHHIFLKALPSDKNLNFKTLDNTKLCASVVLDNQRFTTSDSKLTKHIVDLNGSPLSSFLFFFFLTLFPHYYLFSFLFFLPRIGTQTTIASLAFQQHTLFTIWSDQLTQTSKEIVFSLEQHHAFWSSDILCFHRFWLKTLSLEEGRECVRAVMLTDCVVLLVRFFCIFDDDDSSSSDIGCSSDSGSFFEDCGVFGNDVGLFWDSLLSFISFVSFIFFLSFFSFFSFFFLYLFLL